MSSWPEAVAEQRTLPFVELASPGVPVGGWHEEIDEPPRILLLDDNDVNRKLLRGMLRQEPYQILEARRGQEALALLLRHKIDLVILDLMVPGMSGVEFCRRLKADRRTRFIPVLVLTSVQGIQSEVDAIASGADEFLIKPLHPAVVRIRVRALLRNKAAIDRLEEAETILFALARSIEHRDPYIAGHCERLAWHSVLLGKRLRLSRADLLALYRGGFLHDIGKVAVPDAILHKPGSLTEAEWVKMRQHTTKGEEICRPMKSLARVLPIIRHHHERWDGSGYPDGLRGEDIPLLARILQIADIYDALVTERPYKRALTPEEALEVLELETGRGWRDPELVALFRQLYRNGFSQAVADGAGTWPQLELMRQSLAR